MDSVVSSWVDFVGAYAGWFVGISLASFVVGLVLVPVFVSRIPADYFSQPCRKRRPTDPRQLILQMLITCVKNVFGMVLLLAGLLMVFIPGQGVITMLVGLMIMNYPGKYALERWLIERPHVLPAVNWLRAKYGRAPLSPPVRQTN